MSGLSWLLIAAGICAAPLIAVLLWDMIEGIMDTIYYAWNGDSEARTSIFGGLFVIGVILFFTYCAIASYGTYWGKDLKNPKQPITFEWVEKE